MMGQQLQKVNANLRSKVDEVNNLENRIRQLQQQNEGLRRNQGEMYEKVNIEYKTKITTYETRIR